MRGLASQSFAKTLEKQFHPLQKTWGVIAPYLEPRKNGNEESSKSSRTVADEKVAAPVAAFSRPPPFHPIFGPLVALSFLDSWSKQNSNNDA